MKEVSFCNVQRPGHKLQLVKIQRTAGYGKPQLMYLHCSPYTCLGNNADEGPETLQEPEHQEFCTNIVSSKYDRKATPNIMMA